MEQSESTRKHVVARAKQFKESKRVEAEGMRKRSGKDAATAKVQSRKRNEQSRD